MQTKKEEKNIAEVKPSLNQNAPKTSTPTTSSTTSSAIPVVNKPAIQNETLEGFISKISGYWKDNNNEFILYFTRDSGITVSAIPGNNLKYKGKLEYENEAEFLIEESSHFIEEEKRNSLKLRVILEEERKKIKVFVIIEDLLIEKELNYWNNEEREVQLISALQKLVTTNVKVLKCNRKKKEERRELA